MTHQSDHRDLPVQKAGQAVGAALLQPPLPSNIATTVREGAASAVPARPLRIWTFVLALGDAVRVAGGGPGSRKTGTAAPASCRPGVLPNQRRVLCHLPVARNILRQRSMQRITVSLHHLFPGRRLRPCPADFCEFGIQRLRYNPRFTADFRIPNP